VKRKGKHNHKPSLAIDLLPWPAEINGVNVWSDKQRFSVLAGLMYAAAKEDEKEFPDEWDSAYLRWGGDWDGDGNNADSTLHDMPHFEIAFRN
jgi:peptidoglycan L-alanyl-D-glutamate endopeptidase CwlK